MFSHTLKHRIIIQRITLRIIQIYIKKNKTFVYMFSIACQTAGPNWLTFFEGARTFSLKKQEFKKKFHRQRRALQLVLYDVSYIYHRKVCLCIFRLLNVV